MIKGGLPESQANWTFFFRKGGERAEAYYVQTFLDYSVHAPGSYTVNRGKLGYFGKPLEHAPELRDAVISSSTTSAFSWVTTA